MSVRAVFIVLALAGTAHVCLGHGIRAVRVDGGVGLCATYDDGTPVTFGDVRVFAPGINDKPSLTGTTDRNGYFMFRPDTNGTWLVAVDDGMGHAIRQEITWDGPAAAPAPRSERMPKRYGLLTGLATILGVFGWSAFWKLKRAEQNRR